ncbi:alpha/beta hydrolase family protein [Flavobacterium terrisoli]|uniref:alpha/beta hydrolase family protein n=1 Tax=Flavobacterium terrisoli TaxID=3242195 RepID=UPI0025427CA5|nr:prolyl oligopeptidase family serine peptidase [Flavobacterium buctense]
MPVTRIKNSFILFFLVVSCSVMGQVTNQKNLTEADYHLWSTMEMQAVSAKGDWVSYHLAYESGNDTLFVRNKNATKTHSFPKGYDGKFAKDSWFACMIPENVLEVVNLKTGLKRQMRGATQYAFSSDGLTLITLTDSHQLSIERLDGSATETIDNVTGFFLNPSSTGMVYTIAKEKASLYYCPFDGKREHFQKLVTDGEATFENIVWQRKGQAFAFVKKYKDTLDSRNGKNLHLYQLKQNNIYSFDANTVASIDKGSNIEPPIWTRFTISDDGQRVFFYLTESTPNTAEKPIVQQWNGNDAWTYPQVQLSGRWDLQAKCAVWYPKTGEVRQLTSNDQPKLLLSGDQQYAITYNPMGQKPQFTMLSKTDWYCTNLNTGKRTLFLKNYICDMEEISASYGGKYIVYRNAEHWWVYELATGKHVNISVNIPHLIYDEAYDYAGAKPAFGIAGWTTNDDTVIIYDEYDLWSVNLKNLQAKRLTKGREKQIVFRIANQSGQPDRFMNFDGFTFPELAMEKGVYLKASGKLTKESGYYYWDGKEKPLVFSDKSITSLAFTNESKTLYYMEQDYNSPPSIMAMGKENGQTNLVVMSNTHQKNYHWGKSILISYRNSKNKNLQAALYYPANYDPLKKYPMVVYIYERLSDQVHRYVNPSLLNGAGFNISNLTTQGYFVLQPDLSFELGNVGMSAADCVVSATNVVIDIGLVQPDKIALTGHSFAGYQVSYIATQTKNFFATIVAGAGVSDLIGSYLSIGWNSGRPEIWRYEDQQWRMGKSLYEDMDAYLRNSPVIHAQNITSPLLIWTGELDRQVHYYQTIGFYNALRRLEKKVIMLVYPESGHALSKRNSNIDFTHRYEEWLASYLKDIPAPQWIKKGME